MDKTAFTLRKRMFFLKFRIEIKGKKSDKSLPDTP